MIQTGDVHVAPPGLKLSAKEVNQLAKSTGMAALKIKRVVAYSDIGKHLSANGALHVSRGMALVNADKLEKLGNKIERELLKASSGEGKDTELMVELMKLHLQVSEAQTAVIKTIATGTTAMKGETGSPETPKNAPALADLSELLKPNIMRMTQTTLEVEQKETHEMVSQGDRQ
jgi:hypothetical protein